MRGRTVLLTLAGLAAGAALVTWGASTLGSPQEIGPLPANLPAEPVSPLRGKKVLLVGDSLAVGLTGRMRERAGKAGTSVFASDAENSTMITQWAPHRFPANVTSQKYDFVLVSLGTNDATRQDIGPVKSALDKIVVDAAASGAKLVWLGPPALPSRIPNAEAMRQMIRDTGVMYYPTDRQSFARSSDGVHFTPKGYSDWADAVWDWLEASVAATP